MPYYVVRHGKMFEPEKQTMWENSQDAIRFADARHKATGFHYRVMKAESVWTTKTLADLIKEEET